MVVEMSQSMMWKCKSAGVRTGARPGSKVGRKSFAPLTADWESTSHPDCTIQLLSIFLVKSLQDWVWVKASLKNISCLHPHAICSSFLFQKDSEFEHLEVGFISSNFKHVKKGLSSKVSGKTLQRERQAIPQSDSPHLPQALFLGSSESLYGIVPLTGRRAQENGFILNVHL